MRYTDLIRLDGRGFVVLGAGQGIGEQVVHALSQCGARLLCVDNNEERGLEVAASVGGFAFVADITKRAEVERVFQEAAKFFGGRVDGIVDVVGMPLGGGLAQMDDNEWQRQFDLVIIHAWFALQFGPPLMAQGGSVVFVGSMAGTVARSGSLLAYGAAKAALHHLVKGAAQELAVRGIRVNAVAPGLTRTPRLDIANAQSFWDEQSAQIPLGRPASTSDIAAGVLFLASPMSAHVTGTILAIDGGASLGMQRGIARSG